MTESERNKINAAADTAEKMLAGYEKAPLKQRLKNTVYPLLGRAPVKHDTVFWPAGLLMLGLLECGRPEPVLRYIRRWADKGAPLLRVDDALTGYAILRLIRSGEQALMPLAEKIAAFIMEAPADDAGSVIYGPGGRNRWIYADGTGQTALFLTAYGRLTGKKECAEKGLLQIRNFLASGMDDASYLPYHGFDRDSAAAMGIIGWGRAAGWLLMGMQEAVRYGVMTDVDADILTDAEKLLRAVLSYQRPDGLFSWQLQAKKGYADTSATAMIAWSAERLREYLRDPETAAMTDSMQDRIYPALFNSIQEGRVLGALAECVDFAMYRQDYGCYPWGQGAVLMALGQKNR